MTGRLPRLHGAWLLLLAVGAAPSCGGDGGGGVGPGSNAVATVRVSPPSTTIDVGETRQFSATARNGEGGVVSGATFTWSSSNSSVAPVNGSTGLVTGVRAGTTTITASAGGRQGAAAVTVNDPNPPAAPSDVTATPVSDTEIEVTWTDNSDNETGFVVFRDVAAAASPDGSGPAAVGIDLGANTTSYTDTDLTPGTSYAYSVSACNDNGCTGGEAGDDTSTYPTLAIQTTELPDGEFGVAYSTDLEASESRSTLKWALVFGSLPDGLSLSQNGATGVISGTPTAGGTFDFTVQANADGQSRTRELSITITEALVSFPNTFLPLGHMGTGYSETVTATGGRGPITYALDLGALPPGLALDANTGEISGTPTTAGMYFFRITATSGGTAMTQFSITVSTVGADAFNMNGFDVSGTMPSAAIRTAISAALARWEAVVTGDVSSFPLSGIPEGNCGGFGPLLEGHTVDDMIVLVDIAPIDGLHGTLGSAGPCGLRGGSPRTTIYGRLTLDSDDVDALSTIQKFSLVFHEIGHIVGFGALWDCCGNGFIKDKVTTADGDPRYVGPAGSVALSEYTGSLGGVDADIPLANTGGTGTLNGHWRESIFDAEVMTGYSESGSAPQPISTMTIGAIADLGYTVDLGAADAYSCPFTCAPPPPGVAPLRRQEGAPFDVILNEPILILGPTGVMGVVPSRRRPSGK